jgi:hypothetical protein
MQSFRHFFFRVIAPSPNKTNKFIPYHLIIWKYKYYVINLYIFHDLFIYILWRLVILRCLSIYVTDIFFFGWHKITSIFQPIEKRVSLKIKWLCWQTKSLQQPQNSLNADFQYHQFVIRLPPFENRRYTKQIPAYWINYKHYEQVIMAAIGTWK